VSEFVWPIRVYYEDTDAGGVVYHTSYIRFMERARTEWLRSLSLSQAQLMGEEAVLFSVVQLTVQYKQPAKLDDALQVVSRATLSGGASVEFSQRILGSQGEEMVSGNVLVACLDANTLRPRRLPDALRARLS
jgi:acyl-CoA thioester hydrolase